MKIRHGRKPPAAVLAAVCCALFFSAALQTLRSSQRFTEREARFRACGAWNCAVTGPAGAGEKAAGHLSVKKAGLMRCYTGHADGLLVGTADQAAIELGRLTLQDGRWPREPGEITAEAWALVKNGYSLELGQTVTAAGRPYTLCGVIRSYSQGWKPAFQTAQDVALQALISPDDPLAAGTPVTETALLAGNYTDAESLRELRLCSGGAVFRNDQAYPPAENALAAAIDEEQPLLLLLLCCFLLTLCAVQADRRAGGRTALILRELGADRRQLRQYALRGYIALWGLACLPLTLLGCGAAWLAVRGVNRAFQTELRFHVSLPRLLAGCAFAGLSLIAAAAAPAIRPVRPSDRIPRRFPRLRRISSLASRRLLARLPRTAGRVLCYTLTLCAGMLTLAQVHLTYSVYTGGTVSNDYAYAFQPEVWNRLMPAKAAEEIAAIEGVNFVDAYANLTGYFSRGGSLRLERDSGEDSRYLRTIRETPKLLPGQYPDSEAEIIAVNDSLWSYLCGLHGLPPAGEDGAIALFYPINPQLHEGRYSCVRRDPQRYPDLIYEDTLAPGETLTVRSPGQKDMRFTVCGIIAGLPASVVSSRADHFLHPALLIRLSAMEQIAGQIGYSQIYAYGDVYAMNGAAGDRQAAIYAARNRLQLDNNRQHMVSRRDAWARQSAAAVLAALFLAAFAAVLLSIAARADRRADRTGRAILLALGAGPEQASMLRRRESLIVSGISLTLSAAVLWFRWFWPDMASYRKHWHMGLAEAAAEVCRRYTAHIPGWVYAATLAALVLLPIAAELLPLRNEGTAE